ncbi:unnamed protein product, partial [Iphiclides podalirius]
MSWSRVTKTVNVYNRCVEAFVSRSERKGEKQTKLEVGSPSARYGAIASEQSLRGRDRSGGRCTKARNFPLGPVPPTGLPEPWPSPLTRTRTRTRVQTHRTVHTQSENRAQQYATSHSFT